jgi:hypothetical protein
VGLDRDLVLDLDLDLDLDRETLWLDRELALERDLDPRVLELDLECLDREMDRGLALGLTDRELELEL